MKLFKICSKRRSNFESELEEKFYHPPPPRMMFRFLKFGKGAHNTYRHLEFVSDSLIRSGRPFLRRISASQPNITLESFQRTSRRRNSNILMSIITRIMKHWSVVLKHLQNLFVDQNRDLMYWLCRLDPISTKFRDILTMFTLPSQQSTSCGRVGTTSNIILF